MVNGVVEGGTSEQHVKTQPLPTPAALSSQVSPEDLLIVELLPSGLGSASLIDAWVDALFPERERPSARGWLITDLDRAFANRSDVGPRNRGGPTSPSRSMRWVHLFEGGRRTRPAIVHVYTHRRRWLAVWTGLPAMSFLPLQRYLDEMHLTQAPQSVGATEALAAAHKRLSLATVGRVTARLEQQAVDDQGSIIRELAGDHDQQGESARQARSRRRIHDLATSVDQVQRLMRSWTQGSPDADHLAAVKTRAGGNLVSERTPEDIDRLIAATQSHVQETLSLYSASVVAAEESHTQRFQSMATLIASVLLVPTLVTGIYGSNTEFPGKDSSDGFWAMLIWMAVGSLVVWPTMRRLQGARIAPLSRSARGALLIGLGIVGATALLLALTALTPCLDNLQIAVGVLGVVLLVDMGLIDREDRVGRASADGGPRR